MLNIWYINPSTFSYINNDIQKHLKEHEEAQKLRDSPDLLFRPFLRWLDRNLENLFTKALKQVLVLHDFIKS